MEKWTKTYLGGIDRIVEEVKELFDERSKKGIMKYGTTLHDNCTDDFFKHMKEELMDAILYLHKLQIEREESLFIEKVPKLLTVPRGGIMPVDSKATMEIIRIKNLDIIRREITPSQDGLIYYKDVIKYIDSSCAYYPLEETIYEGMLGRDISEKNEIIIAVTNIFIGHYSDPVGSISDEGISYITDMIIKNITNKAKSKLT